MQIKHVINAPARLVWNILIDTHQWPVWGPSIRAVQSPQQYIIAGLKGRIQTVIGVWLPFEITDFEPMSLWNWKVAGMPATGHRVTILDEDRCELIFEMPFAALPYGLVCLQAARKIDRLAQRHKE